MTPSQLIAAVRRRAAFLLLAKGGDPTDAEKEAARQLALEGHRAELPHRTTSIGRVVDFGENLRNQLTEQFIKLFERMEREMSEPPPTLREQQEPRTRMPRYSKQAKRKPADESTPILLYGGNTTGAQLIPDEEFHGMPDRTTSNWRRSIEENERVERERREHWEAILVKRRSN